MDERDRASTRWMFSSPGIPNTWVTPSRSRHSTIRSATRGGDPGTCAPPYRVGRTLISSRPVQARGSWSMHEQGAPRPAVAVWQFQLTPHFGGITFWRAEPQWGGSRRAVLDFV